MVTKQIKFSEAKIRDLTAMSQTVCYYDTEVPGLGVRVSPLGTKTFIWYRWVKDKTGSRPERRTIGRYPDLSVQQARDQAYQLNAGRAQGSLPIDHRHAADGEMTWGELADLYIEQYAQERCTTWKKMQGDLSRWFGDWHKKKLSAISKSDVQARINKLGKENGHHAANKAHNEIRAVFSWALKKNYFNGAHPGLGIDTFQVASRERFIQPEEFQRFMAAVEEEDPTMRDFIKMCLLTGQRKTNVMQMRWDQINFELGTWFIPITKNGESLTVTLTEQAVKILKGRQKLTKEKEWVFPSDRTDTHIVEPKSAWRRILKRAKLGDLRIHDLRRTMGSYMAIQNVNSPIIGKALGHKSLTAAARYQRVNSDPVKAAMENATAQMLKHAKTSKSTKTAK